MLAGNCTAGELLLELEDAPLLCLQAVMSSSALAEQRGACH
jgi:hypothetical protein